MNKIKLCEIVTVIKGKKVAFSDDHSAIPVIDIQTIRSGKAQFYTNDKQGVICNEKDVLVVWDGANCGTVGTGLSGALGSTVAALKINPNSKVTHKFLKIFLDAQFSMLNSRTTGSTIPHLDRQLLLNIEIPVLTKDIQLSIVKVLEKAESAIHKRKEAIQLADEYLKSVFLEMFGEPALNSKVWQVIDLGTCLNEIQSGWSPVCNDREVTNDEWGICKLSAVTGGFYKENENKALAKDKNPKIELKVNKDDLLFTRKNTRELVGSCAYVFETTKKLMLPDTIFRFCTTNKINKLYLWGLLNFASFRPFIKQLAGGSSGSMPNISKERLKKLQIPLPNIALQNQFADIVLKVEALKKQQQKSLEELETIFKSLMQRAFKGELV